jgi:hypothetical protein
LPAESRRPALLSFERQRLREPAPMAAVMPPVQERADASLDPARELEVAHALQTGRALLQRAIASGGRWTDQDRQQLHEQLAALPQDQAGELIREVIVAVNSDKLRPESPGLPF